MNNPKETASKGSKLTLGVKLTGSFQKPIVPPVLKEVSRLAAGVASVNAGSGSATGNPRNKCALKPGHSLMDWIRLGSSGKDLTGVGPQSGKLSVTQAQLKQHDKITDAWLAIRGRVYNVTEYMSFHPGGPMELMKGVGQDATALFDEVHPWVNYEQILQKCVVGRLVGIDPSVDKEALFFGNSKSKSNTDITNTLTSNINKTNSKSDLNNSSANNSNSNSTNSNDTSGSNKSETNTIKLVAPATSEPKPLPRFDWIQKLDSINLIFYTKSFSNPQVEVTPLNTNNSLNIILTYDRQTFTNELNFSEAIRWPCQIKINYETGKIEINFKKFESQIWENYGILTQKSEEFAPKEFKFQYKIIQKVQVNHKTQDNNNIYLIELQKLDGGKLTVPLGKHVRFFAKINEDEQKISRSYTAVPDYFFSKKIKPQPYTTDNVCLMIKSYTDGKISKYICAKNVGDVVEISKPLGDFRLQNLEDREVFLMLAAGTGITPMIGLIGFLLERRTRKCHSVQLLFFNRTEEDIPFKDVFNDLEKEDSRFTIKHILSEPKNSKWKGLKGRITSKILDEAFKTQIGETPYTKNDLYVTVCGPQGFTNSTEYLLKDHLKLQKEQYHLFLG